MPTLLQIITGADLIQYQDVISFNVWQVLISLLNLLLLFLLFKHFLFKPVKKVIDERKKAVNAQYDEAEKAKLDAEADKNAWDAKMEEAETEANAIIASATANANRRSDAIIEEARVKAGGIVRQAETAAELERRKAEEDIKQEIVDISTLLTEKMLSREIKEDDHRELIDSFISEIGDKHE